MSRALRVVLLVLAAAAALVAVPATAAHAADPVPAVLVVIDTLNPVVPAAGGALTVQGRVISTSRADITGLTVVLRRSTAPLATRKEVAVVAASPMSPPGGDPDPISLSATRQTVADSLPPGAQVAFTLTIPFADMGLSTAGTYAIGVEAVGRESGVDTADVRKGVVRTFLPWFPTSDSVRPVSLAWLWPLADSPNRTATGVLLSNQTPLELSAGGRLDRLVDLGERFPGEVSWIADPALLETANDMTEGYQVVVDGTTTVGDREQQARLWLARVARLTPGLRTTPYADVDASAVVRAGMSNDVVRAVTTGPRIAADALRAVAPGGLYWAPFGRLDRNAANVLASAGVTAVVLSADAMPPAAPAVGAAAGADPSATGSVTTALPTSFGTVRAVLADPGLTAVLAEPQRTASDVVLARQRFLAETALIATSLPADQAQRDVVVAPASMRWDPAASLLAPLLRATRTAPWLASTTLDQLLGQPVSTTARQHGGYGARARSAELPPDYMDAISRATEKVGSFTSIIDDPTGISEPFSAAILRAESAAWRTNLTSGRQLVASINSDLANDMSRVRVLSTGTITFSGDNGRVPVTIANDLDRAVTVGLSLNGRPPLRLESTPLTGIHIEAGKMASVDIDARVVGGDPLTVNVQLLDATGASYGRPAFITVSSTAYARAAAWVVAGAFVAILVFVVVGVTRRIRKAQTGPRDVEVGP